jgi:hypothetical protein
LGWTALPVVGRAATEMIVERRVGVRLRAGTSTDVVDNS